MIVHDTREEREYLRFSLINDLILGLACLVPIIIILVMALI